MAPFNGAPSHRQQVALAMAPKVAAPFSMLGSSYITYDAICKLRRTQTSNKTFYRLMIGLSVCDFIMSGGLFTSTWPMPTDTPLVWGAVGNVQSCEAVGFLEQSGVGAVMYNGSLSIYYLFRIRYGWKPSQLRKVEIWLHTVPIVFALTTMIASLPLKLFNSGLFDCWIAPFPQGCEETWRSVDGTTTCERGDNASLYQWIFDLIPKWTSILLVTINAWLIHRAVWKQEQKTLQYSMKTKSTQSGLTAPSGLTPTTAEPRRREGPMLSRRLARQNYFYVGSLYLTYIPVIITRLTELSAGFVHYEMLLTISITIPLQGLWNCKLRASHLRRMLVPTS